MQVETKRLGTVKVISSEEMVFEQGLPGFEQERNFTALELEIDLPIKLLQCDQDPDISLLIGNPFHFYPDYEWDLPQHAQQELQIAEADDVEVWSVIILPANAAEATINLLAPIVVNRKNRLAKQIILHNSKYSNRHSLLGPAEGDNTQGQGE